MPTCDNCGGTFPNKKKIDGKVRVLNSRRYCLNCSPFGEHNTVQIHRDEEIGTCRGCGKEFDYDSSDRNGNRRTRCSACRTKKRRDRLRRELIDQFGGECVDCGYDRCYRALEFHHRNPDEKTFPISGNILRRWTDVVEEAKKCDLICANCHRERHCNDEH